MKTTVSVLGCGWLGKAVAKDLIKARYEVKGSSTSPDKINQLADLGIKPYLVELGNDKATGSDFFNTDVLIVAFPPKPITTVQQLVNEIELAGVKNIIFISSTSVYAPSDEVLTETSAMKDSMLTQSEQCFTDNNSFKTTIIRFAGLFGYDRNPGNFFGPNIQIKNPEGVVNMIHRDDSVQIITEVLHQDCFGEVFNACADSHPSRREFYTKAALIIGKPVPNFDEHGKSEYKYVDNTKLKKRLAYKYMHPDLLKALAINN